MGRTIARAILVLVAITASGQVGFEATQLNAGAVGEFRRAWAVAGLGNRDLEVVVLIKRHPDGSFRASLANSDKRFRSIHFRWSPAIVAIFHTHPDRSEAVPSRQDRKLAARHGIPVYTLSNRGMWRYDPATKKTEQLIAGLRWLKVANWGQ